jgi:hypothetical protein
MNRLAAQHGPAITKAIVEGAKLGDAQCRQLFFKYIAPKSKLNPEPGELATPQNAAEAAAAIATMTSSIVGGTLDLDTAQAAIAGLQAFVSARNVADLEQQAIEMREEIARLRAETETMKARTS